MIWLLHVFSTYFSNLVCFNHTGSLASSPTRQASPCLRAIAIAISLLLEQFPFRNLHSCFPHLMIRFLLTRSSIKRPALSISPKRASSHHSYPFILISFPTKLATLLGIIYYLVIYYVYWLLSTFLTIIRGRLFLFTAEFPTPRTMSAP